MSPGAPNSPALWHRMVTTLKPFEKPVFTTSCDPGSTSKINGRKRGKHGEDLCFMEEALLIVTTQPGAELYDEPFGHPAIPLSAAFTAQKIFYRHQWDAARLKCLHVHVDNENGYLNLTIEKYTFRGVAARLWAHHIRLKTPDLRWMIGLSTRNHSTSFAVLGSTTTRRGLPEVHVSHDLGVIFTKKQNDFSPRYCVIRDATMFLYWDEQGSTTPERPSPPRNLGGCIQIGPHPTANGGFASVHKNTWDNAGETKHVAVKVIRKQDGADVAKLNKEATAA
ncbi:hypothetical protein B0H13DRAFT_2550048 [Mycena leptocephala]|nr:hypothetical protein B0H13DRAFT_2550048 [Mycena leptocephala]